MRKNDETPTTAVAAVMARTALTQALAHAATLAALLNNLEPSDENRETEVAVLELGLRFGVVAVDYLPLPPVHA